VAAVVVLGTFKVLDPRPVQMELPTLEVVAAAVQLAMAEPQTELINAPMVETVALELSLFDMP
jgi:hypothetical protein